MATPSNSIHSGRATHRNQKHRGGLQTSVKIHCPSMQIISSAATGANVHIASWVIALSNCVYSCRLNCHGDCGRPSTKSDPDWDLCWLVWVLVNTTEAIVCVGVRLVAHAEPTTHTMTMRIYNTGVAEA